MGSRDRLLEQPASRMDGEGDSPKRPPRSPPCRLPRWPSYARCMQVEPSGPTEPDSELSRLPPAKPGAGDCDLPRRLSTGPSPRCLEGKLSGAGELERPRKLSTGPSMADLSATGDGPRPRPMSRPRPWLLESSGAGDCERPRRLSTGPRPRRPPPDRDFSAVGEGALPFSMSTGPRPRLLDGGLSGAGDLDRPRRLSTGPSMLVLSATGEGPRPLESPLLLGEPSGAGDWPRPCKLSTGPSIPLPDPNSGAGDCGRPSDLSWTRRNSRSWDPANPQHGQENMFLAAVQILVRARSRTQPRTITIMFLGSGLRVTRLIKLHGCKYAIIWFCETLTKMTVIVVQATTGPCFQSGARRSRQHL